MKEVRPIDANKLKVEKYPSLDAWGDPTNITLAYPVSEIENAPTLDHIIIERKNMTKKEMIALKAVITGCQTNSKLIPYGAYFFDGKESISILYEDAINIMKDYLSKLEKELQENE